jgi:glucan phosphoethanolaminetransferase (alkaline phosphatase superfamily)
MTSHPRTLLVTTAALFGITAVITMLYPPGYLGYPYVWSLLALMASTTSALAAARCRRFPVLLSGALAVVASVVRCVAIVVEVAIDPQPAPVRWSFWLAATTWGVLAVLLHALWVHVIIPWSTFRRLAE